MRVTRAGGAGGRTFGTIVGIIGGIWAAGAVASSTDSAAAGWSVLIGGTTALGVLGCYAGKQIDTRTTRITIVP